MPKRTSPKDARFVETADDLDEVVTDKRAGWRANPAKARRRQRRYKKKLVDEITSLARDGRLDGFDD
ncbi:hypothetical protein [Shimia ponticola]|uniref:hypothetical protein n=1 Tax=Shimia ponticola TaxID=2582893 RepID=UPI0011BEB61F|nr:hypothetical protein [Shimia ponticola]